jgi:uncharacterized protein YkwD
MPARGWQKNRLRRATRILALTLVALNLNAGPAEATTDREQALHELINQARHGRGLVELRLSDKLSKVARTHSSDMAEGSKILYHSCLTCRLQSWNWSIAGENVGHANTIARVHRLLMESASHRANVLRSPFRTVGVGVVARGGRLWVTQIFLG